MNADTPLPHQGPRLVLNIRREHTRLLPSSLDDVDLELPPTQYARVSTDDVLRSDDEEGSTEDEKDEKDADKDAAPRRPSRASFASWRSRVSWNRASLSWVPWTLEKHEHS